MAATSFQEIYLQKYPEGALADEIRKRIAEERAAPPVAIRKTATPPTPRDVFAEITKRAEALIAKDSTLSLGEATARALNSDPVLYDHYRSAALGREEPVEKSAVQAEIDRLADAEIQKSGCDRAEAVRKVLNADHALYSRYRKANTAGR